MRLSSGIENSRQAARQLLASLRLGREGTDEVAVYSFDIELQSLQPFTADSAAIEGAFSHVAPYGQTSLYDAIAQTARRVAETPHGDRHRRAVVVFTDGVDTSSQMTPTQVSAIASAIDVPVYIVTVVAPIDRPDGVDRHGAPDTALRTLARLTGGDLFVTSAPAHESTAARQIVDELRHQYFLAFNASTTSGWHAVDIKVRDRDLTVRARSGYAAAGGDGSEHTLNGQSSERTTAANTPSMDRALNETDPGQPRLIQETCDEKTLNCMFGGGGRARRIERLCHQENGETASRRRQRQG
jgi:VWFA-related protein